MKKTLLLSFLTFYFQLLIHNVQAQVCFTSAYYPLDKSSTTIASADFNSDGKPDLVSTNYSGDPLYMMLGNGLGSFGTATIAYTFTEQFFGAQSIISRDFNGDGKADLAIANTGNPGGVKILFGNGAGGFPSSNNLSTGFKPWSICSADFNGDGNIDLATGNKLSISILLGDGAGNFGAYIELLTGPSRNLNSITSGDFNGDGKADIVVTNSYNGGGPDSIWVLLGNGSGSFGTPAKYLAGSGPISVCSKDLNGDGFADIAVANNVSNNVSVFLSQGVNGLFNSAINYPVGFNPMSIVSSDFNADGILDLATIDHNNTASILLGIGTGSFGTSSTFAALGGAYTIISADFNLDGKPDLAAAGQSSNNVSVLLNTPLQVTANATNTTVCAGTSITLTGGGATTYTWTGGVTDGLAFTPISTTTYMVTGTTASGCYNTATKAITVNPLPVSIAGNDLTICSGISGSIGATAVAGNTYSWNPSTGLSSGTASNPSNTTVNSTSIPIVTTYTVTTTITATGCQSADNSVITVNPQPVLVITNPAAVCFPNTVDITAGAVTAGSTGGGILTYWTDAGATNPLSSPNALTTSGTNYIKVTATGGCMDIKPVTATVNPLPVSNAGNDLTICSGTTGSIGATAVAGNTYSWNPSIGLSSGTVSNPSNTTINSTSAPIATTYTVTTTITATGCQSADNSVITVNPQPVLVITTPASVCFPNTVNITLGAVTVGSTGGGTFSYWTDAGATSALSFPNALTTSGTNYIKVTATGGCTDVKAGTVTVNPQPSATFTTQNESSSLYCDGSVKAHLTGGTGTIQPQWLDSIQTVLSSTDSIGGLCHGFYTLHLTDANNCTNNYTKTIAAGPIPPIPGICLVTVDSTHTHNTIVWEKTNLNMEVIDSFLVYREYGTNSYHHIGSLSNDSMSTFIDFSANPSATGYRYKLKSKNAHGVTSLFSDYHNTIYLTNSGANFSWTQYQIENNTTPVSLYNLFRDDNSTGNFQNIGFTSGNQFGYTDVNFSSYPNASYYVEAVMVSGDCHPTRSGFNASRSNVKYFGTTEITQLNNNVAINIYPNPATNTLTITGIAGKTTLRLYDIVGKLVLEKEVENNITINTSQLEAGIYTLLTVGKTGRSINKVVISH